MEYTEDGLEAIVFTAQGDMRQALNNLQSTCNGFGLVKSENVFKVCDEPHPLLIKEMLQKCIEGNVREAFKIMEHLWRLGYAAEDIIKNVFKVCKNLDIDEPLKLAFIKVCTFFTPQFFCQFVMVLGDRFDPPKDYRRTHHSFANVGTFGKVVLESSRD